MKKGSISDKKLFLIIYICIFCIKLLIDFLSELSSGGENFSVFWMIIIADGFLTLFFLSPFWLIIRSIKDANKSVKNESLSKIDFINNKEYYRDILEKYSLAELSYIDDFKVDYPKDIIITLLRLALKRKISIVNNYIEIIDFNTADLKQSESYVLDNIKDGKVKVAGSHDIIKYAQSEALEDKLIVESGFKVKSIIFKTLLKVFLQIIVLNILAFNSYNLVTFISSFNLPDNVIFMIILIFCFLLIFLFSSIPFSFIKMFFYLLLKSKSYKRTDIGEEINKKIEGLRNYVKDFSVLDKREKHELMIWDEYLIYSVLFEQNQNIINELSSLVEADIEVGKVYFEYNNNTSNN